MKQVPFTNNTNRIRTVGRQMTMPGETIYIDERDHPEFTRRAPQREQKKHSDPVLELLDNSVATIAPELPTLTSEQFDRIQQAERDGNKTRTSLRKKFDEEFQRRAGLVVDAGMEYDEFLEHYLSADDDALAEHRQAEIDGAARQSLIAAFEAEIVRRTPDSEQSAGE